MIYDLPESLKIGGKSYGIRTDFRAVLDAISALTDEELQERERVLSMLMILYKDAESIPPEQINEAISQAMWFISCGEDDTGEDKPKVFDWDQDYSLIIAPINRVLGYECRAKKNLHWWTFISAYMEIGECSFSSVVSIRKKLQKNKKLESWEKEFYRENRALVDLKNNLTAEEQEFIKTMFESR